MSKEYIERDALLTVLKTVFHETDPNGAEQHDVLKLHRIVREAPAADVVEVVRCRDCKYFLLYDRACDHPDGLVPGGGDQFCCYGERKGKN